MSEDLPEGWARTTLARVCSHRSGSSKRIKGKLHAGAGPGRYQGFSASGPDVWSDTWDHEGEAIVVSAVGARCGRAFKARGRWSATTNTYVVWPRLEAVELDYLFLYLDNEGFWAKGGSAQPFVKVRETFERPLALPPRPEQRRIVAKVEALLAEVNASRARLARASLLLRRLRRAVLAAACSGRLTEDWRASGGAAAADGLAEGLPGSPRGAVHEGGAASGDPAPRLPASWTVRPFGALVDNHDGRRVPVRAADRERRRGPYPYYGASGIIDTIDGYLFDGDYLLVAEDGANLLSRSTAVAFSASGRFWVNNHAHVVQPKAGVVLGYLEGFLNGLDLQHHVTGSAQPKLTQAALNAIPVPLPPPEEQAEIVRRAQAVFALAGPIEERVAAAAARAEKLPQVILARALSGQLVPTEAELARAEGRDYEPAEELLRRIPGGRLKPGAKQTGDAAAEEAAGSAAGRRRARESA
ncbi:subunit S of type I restriction-modification system [Sorangium cellulosum]|uniref:Subunit S of type I restriction-modification system n=1 Tax=Sorangium cellulosum TaxID=56 RepID=A0A2L0F1G8_SORCE|nr:restriction endonuclease subunit S [Sorangium cellulosum]AUX45341.1 subunit S of type I restriction-modification system [Sorangium cellulosum]